MLLPRRIYEYLPAMYVVFGFIAGQVIESNLALGSGILLTVAGIHVFYMRLNHRVQWEEIEIKGLD